ncbi:hypothetical protein ACFVYE_25430 [Streptomyces sp. NPDC058239]|uniref:hypothetical protein n=1 Tax=Streptomyces sp. NPDC058239 TaxID=3346395 RepID=UPI0036ECD1F6
MSSDARLTSVETDSARQAVAAAHLGTDPRIAFEAADGDTCSGPPLALAYVDRRPGKFHRLDGLLDLLEPGRLHVVDDLLPQPTCPSARQSGVDLFLAHLTDQPTCLPLPRHGHPGYLSEPASDGLS